MNPINAVQFVVPGAPIGKGRPRIGKVGGNARMYTPAKTANYEGLIAHAASQAMADTPPFGGACSVEIDIVCPIPLSWSKKKRTSAIAHQVLPTTKPDTDNVIKAVFDGLNGVVWRDDVQAVDLRTTKRYGETPRVCVRVIVCGDGAQ